MKISKLLSVSAELPPFNFGGYEVGAWRASYALRELYGVEVYLLTSMRGVETGLHLGEKYCYRLLPRPGCRIVGDHYVPHNNPVLTKQQKQLSIQLMQEVVESVQPDAVLFWQVFANCLYSLEILNYLKRKGIPAYLYCSNYNQLSWLNVVSPEDLLKTGRWRELYGYLRTHFAYWRRGQALELAFLDWSNVAFCSDWLKQKHIELGWTAQDSKVLHWGIDVEPLQMKHSLLFDRVLPLKLLWAGRICPEKGLHILIEALKQLPTHYYILDIFGYEQDKVYIDDLRTQVKQAGLESFINFKGFIQAHELRKRMPEYDIFLLTSIWEEPFSIVLLEAAAAGLALISTLTGGTPEIVSENNALVYQAESPEQLATCLRYLCENLLELARFKKLAYETVKKFTLEKMVQELYTWISNE